MPNVRRFTHYNETWYSRVIPRDNKNDVDEVMIGLYAVTDDGHNDGCCFEFAVRWVRLGGEDVPRVEVFSDTFKAFTEFADVFAMLSVAPKRIEPREVCALLKAMGFADATERTRPDGDVGLRCPMCSQVLAP